MDVVDPSTGEVVDRVTLLRSDEVQSIIDTAVSAFAPWARTSVGERRRLLVGMAAALSRRRPALAREFSFQHGKLRTEAETELNRAVETIEWTAHAIERVTAPRPLMTRPGLADRQVHVQAAGPVLAIVPWNFPAVVLARKLAPALAMGCTIVVKGPEEVPCVARAFLEAAVEAGIPPDVVQLVHAEPTVATELVRSPAVRHISFTGSTRVGRIIAATAAENLTPCVLELGGHAPAIVTADVDVDRAAAMLATAKFASAGQSCGAPSRFLVQRPVYEEFLARLCDHADQRTLGPLATAARRQALHDLVLDAKRKGAIVRCGGRRVEGPGFHYPPTVLADVPHDARILVEEPFGPVAPVLPYEHDDDAVGLANDSDYALSAYVFGKTSHAAKLAERIVAGSVAINAAPSAFPDAPLGGRRLSGHGYEGGDEGLLTFGRLSVLQSEEELA